MALDNPWVNYVTRSYLQIKDSLLQRLGQLVPEVTDHSESNILVIIISMFAGVAENLNYYIDNMAREAFITTARRYSSVVKHTRLIDYRIKAMNPASVNVNVSFFDNNDIPKPIDQTFIIPAGTVFKTENNIKFISLNDYEVQVGQTVLTIPCEQKTLIEDVILGQAQGIENEFMPIGSNYVHNSIYLTVGDIPWERQETLGRSEPEDLHYIVDISSERIAYVRFGDLFNGAIPSAGNDVVATYYESVGVRGNVNSNSITKTEFDFTSTPASIEKTIINNPLASSGGMDFESRERIAVSAPLSLRTLDRAVTRQDYIDITKLAPGVDKASLFYECGKYIDIYISPVGGGVAQTPLLNSTLNWLNERKMVTTFIRVLPTGESDIFVKMDVTAKFRRDTIVTKQDIINALLEEYSYTKSDINRPIRVSDIIALIDNLPKVDFLNLEKLYLIPYFRPVNHSQEILKEINMRSGSDSIISWRLQYSGTHMRLFKETEHLYDLLIDEEYIDPQNIIQIKILAGDYELGQEWLFKTYPFNNNIEVNDYSVPVIKLENIHINVNEQLSVN